MIYSGQKHREPSTLSEDTRVAIIGLTNVMGERLIKYPTVLSGPKFSIPNSVIPSWNLGRSYLGIFADTDDRTGKRKAIGLGILVPRKKNLSYEPATINDFCRVEPPIAFERLYNRLGDLFSDALNDGPSKSDARSRRLIAALRSEAPYLNDRLDELVSKIDRMTVFIPTCPDEDRRPMQHGNQRSRHSPSCEAVLSKALPSRKPSRLNRHD